MTNRSIKTSEPSIEARTDDLLQLSRLVNQFMAVKRATLRNGRAETDGEHTLHLQFLAVAYGARYHPELNIGKVSLYALVHDFIEVFAGDVNSLSATSEELAKKAQTEELALERLAREAGGAWPEFVAAVRRYELLEEPETRFVKCFDKCDPSFPHFVNKGEALHRMGIVAREDFMVMCDVVRKRMGAYAGEFPDVLAVRQNLLNRVADAAYSTV